MNTVYDEQEEEYQGNGHMVICPKRHREHFSSYELLTCLHIPGLLLNIIVNSIE